MSLATPSSSPPTTPISTSRMIFALPQDSSSSAAMARFSCSSVAEPSHMCDWNNGCPPALTRSAEIATRGRTKESSLPLDGM